MIESGQLTKNFGAIAAVNNVTVSIGQGQVFGLLGTNGAGKSTMLRLIAGILKQDSGSLTIDGGAVFEAPETKQKCFYISDDQYFFPNAYPDQIADYYGAHYPGFDLPGFHKLLDAFGLDRRRKINTFSKGMKKQLSILCGLSANTPYLLCDETFDGLDPVMRQAVKSLFADGMERRGLTPVIASHNLRELEDICDHVGLLHQGGLLLSRDLEEMKLNVHKVQAVFEVNLMKDDLWPLEIISLRDNGRLQTMLIRGDRETVEQAVGAHRPIFMELLPLTLEEVFISETEVAGYEIRNLAL